MLTISEVTPLSLWRMWRPAGRHGTENKEKERQRHRDWDCLDFWNLRTQGTPPSARPQLLRIQMVHQLGTKHAERCAYGRRSHSGHHSISLL